LGIAKLAETDGHDFMSFRRLIAIGAEQTIPPRHIEAKIAVALSDDYGVVQPTSPARMRIDSMVILKARYAKGEISTEEFKKMKQFLSQS